MRTWARALLSTAFLFSSQSLAAESIDGYVVNPVSDQRLAGIEVGFSISGPDGSFSEMIRKSTDADGRFSFSGPFLTDGMAYSLTAYYGDIPYASSMLLVGGQRQVILEVFDPTTDPGAVTVSSHHLFLTVGNELLDVAELMQLYNAGDSTFVGVHEAETKLVTELSLPEGVFNFRSAGQRPDETGAFVHDHDSFFHTDPLVPGHSQITFTFQVDLAEFTGTYRHVAPYHTERLDIYLQPASIELGEPFHDLGTVILHDQSYRRYHVNDLALGKDLAIALPMSRPIRWTLKWVALGLTCFVSLAGLGLSSHRASSTTANTAATSGILAAGAGVDASVDIGELERLRNELLKGLASTDKQAQPAEYGQLMDRTVALYRLMAIKRA